MSNRLAPPVEKLEGRLYNAEIFQHPFGGPVIVGDLYPGGTKFRAGFYSLSAVLGGRDADWRLCQVAYTDKGRIRVDLETLDWQLPKSAV